MKKLLSFILLIALLLSIVSCVSNGNDINADISLPAQDSTTESQTEKQTEKQTETEPVSEIITTEPVTEIVPEDTTSNNNPSTDTETTNNNNNPPTESGSSNNNGSMNAKVDFVGYLVTLLKEYRWNPKSVIPETLSPEYRSKNIDKNSLSKDYSNFVAVSNIPQNGIGEQWNMTVENILESQIFFNLLSVVDNVSTVSVTAFNNFFDENPADTAHYEFEHGIYNVTIDCTPTKIYYVLEYSAELPVLGNQTVQIALSMDILTQVKDVRVQIGDANALAYTISDNKYTFALKYLGARTAYFELIKNPDNTITGHIYEYLTVSSLEIASVSDFYITKDYLTVVGNKASGMVGFSGYICELYSISSGEMIGYEVKETNAAVTYNTLWFDLEDINGINSIKYVPATSNNEDDAFYINNSSSAWTTKTYGITGGLKVASRRFDIEFRTQYFYYYNSAEDSYEKVKVDVPMLFVQEEVMDNLSKDVKEKNKVEVSINISSANIDKLKNEYSSKTNLIESNKEKFSSAKIVEYIGKAKVFA